MNKIKSLILVSLLTLSTINTFSQTYCTPTTNGANPSSFYCHILQFSFGEFNLNYAAPWNTTSPVYYDYSTQTTTVVTGHSYPLFVVLGNGGNTQTLAIWIDYNQNKVFETNERLYNVTDYANVGDHIVRANITIPTNATLGTTRLRIGTIGGTNIPVPCNNTNPDGSMHFQDYSVNIVSPAVQKYLKSNVVQYSTDEVTANSVNNAIVSVVVNTNVDGTLTPLSADTFLFSLFGTTNPSEILNAKLFYTGKSPEFRTISQVGSTISKPGTYFSIAAKQKLEPGNNYFWLTYDVASTAIIGNSLDARCNSIFINNRKFPETIDPTGVRNIGYCISKGNKSQFVYTRRVTIGTINNGIQYYSTPGYSNYTYLTTTLYKNQYHTLSVETGNGVNTNYIRAWVDFDRDGVFDNVNELVLFDSITSASATNPNYGPVVDSFMIPLNSPVGPTRLRVSSHYNPVNPPFRTPAYPCENPLEVGEVEDYTIVIADSGQTVADFKSTVACFGSPTTFTDASYTFGTQYVVSSWVWEFGDGDTSHAQHPSHTYKNPGVYNVKLTAKTNAPGAIIGTVTKAVKINKPVANFSWSNILYKVPTKFFDESSGGTATAWYWDFGDPSSGYNNYSNLKSPTHTYNVVGPYDVTFIVTTEGNCRDTVTKRLDIDSIITPLADYSASTYDPYYKQDVTLLDLSVNFPNKWHWVISPASYQFKNGTDAFSQNPVISFDTIGMYVVKLVTSNAKGSDSISKLFNVKNYTKPLVDFEAMQTSVKAGQLVSFLDKSTNDPNQWLWTFGDGDTVYVQHPNHVYENIGNYSVSLTASNPAGSNKVIKTNYVKVTNEYQLCDNDAPVTNLFSGFIFDSGGKDAAYKNNTNCGFLIKPECAGAITLTFHFLDYDVGDYLMVYDGVDENGIPLFTGTGFTGTVKPSPVVALSGAMYIVEKTNNTTNASGFAASWNAVPNIRPKAIIDADTIGYVNGPVTFFNKTVLGSGNSYEWDYDNDGIYDDKSLHGNFKFDSLGTYIIALKATNCAGQHIVYHTIRIIMPTKPPFADFTSDKDTVSEGEKVYFYDLSTNGPSKWKWEVKTYDYWSAYYFADGTSDTSQNPVIEFYGTDVFDISLTSSNDLGTSPTMVKKKYIVTIAKATMGSWPFEIESPAGRIFDSGGPDGDYSNNENYSLLLKPCAKKVYLRFSKFDLAVGDYLRIYDGKDNTGKPLHPGTGFTSNAMPSYSVALIANSGYMYLEQVTNNNTVASGFIANWYIDPIPLPKASFNFKDTAYTQGAVTFFENTSTGKIDKCYWDYDYDGFNDDSTFHGVYSYTSPKSNQYVFLKVMNCSGESNASNEFVVIDPFQQPFASFEADKLIADTLDKITFKDHSFFGPTTWQWQFDPPYAHFINPEGENYPYPQVKFDSVGYYDVTMIISNSFGSDTLVKADYIKIFAFCRPTVSNLLANFGISKVKINDLENDTKAGTTAYTDYTDSKSVTLEIGGHYLIELQSPAATYAYSRKVWIDYNQDGIFSEPGELAASSSNEQTIVWQDSVKVPSTALLGPTRMRISANYAGYPNTPCGPNFFGEYEDYRVTITDDHTAPAITILGNNPMLTEISYPYFDPGAQALDAVEGDLTTQITTFSNVNIDKVGQYQVKYNVEDSKGNKSEEEIRTVFVTPDKTKPVISLIGDDPQMIAVYHSYVEQGALAIDNLDGDISINLMIQHHIDTSKVDTYYVSYTAYDFTGNFAETVQREVYVADTIAPVIILIGSDTLIVEKDSAINDPGTDVSDNYYQDVQVTTTTNVDINTDGWYWIRYDATDGSGNNAKTVVRTIKVGTPISVEEITSKDIVSVYPNPGNGLFILSLSLSNSQDIKIEVINSLGQRIQNYSFDQLRSAQKVIDLSGEAEGMYYIKTFLNDNVIISKVTLVR